jgi:hypothetical protein
MSHLLVEYTCARWLDEDLTWRKHGLPPADLRLRIWGNNLVTLEFIADDQTLGLYRLCWGAFRDFIEHVDRWFFQSETYEPFTSCIDPDVTICCMPYVNYGVSMTFGRPDPEFGFCAARDQYLAMLDAAARFMVDLPDADCFDPNSTASLIIIN